MPDQETTQAAKSNGLIEDFVNPKSMMTPGLAGGFAMTIANSLWVQFGLQPRWSALGLSFALGLMVFASQVSAPVWQRCMYYVLNSLVIFSAATGANYLGSKATPPAVVSSIVNQAPSVSALLHGSTANAQPIEQSEPRPQPTPRTFFPPW
jgi:hypothetical protein